MKTHAGGSIGNDLDASMHALPVRLRPGDDLRDALVALIVERGADAAFVIAGIGSLASSMVRFAGADDATPIDGAVEILTLSGSLATDGAHLHISVADATGRVFGGHVGRGCIVRTTAEVLVALLPDWRFAREADATTGYDELAIRPA